MSMDGLYAVFAGAKNGRTQAKRCETLFNPQSKHCETIDNSSNKEEPFPYTLPPKQTNNNC